MAETDPGKNLPDVIQHAKTYLEEEVDCYTVSRYVKGEPQTVYHSAWGDVEGLVCMPLSV